MRRQLAGSRKEADGLEQKLSLSQSLVYDLRQGARVRDRENIELRDMVLAKVNEAEKATRKATRRGWVVAGLTTLLGGLIYLNVAY